MRASEMRKGQTVSLDGKLYVIVDYQHVKLGKGGAVYQTKLKSLTDGSIQNVRLRAEESIEEAYLDKRTYEYLYSAGSEHVLMDTTNYDQITLDDDAFGHGSAPQWAVIGMTGTLSRPAGEGGGAAAG